MKKYMIPAIIFMVSAISSLLAIPLAILSFVVGIILLIVAFARGRRADNSVKNSSYLKIYGMALMIAPILTVGVVITGMSGAFN
jgi:mannose/fructose/N-acetylgalactosamine-specific phosphotransferase system component IIC